MEPTSALMVVLFALLGLWLGNLRSRSIGSDLFILGLWAIFFVINPTMDLGAAIVGYLAGWGVRCLRMQGANEGPTDNDRDS